MQRMASLVQLGVGLEECARWWCVALLLQWACKPETCRAKINKYCIKLVINSYLNQMQGTTIQNFQICSFDFLN